MSRPEARRKKRLTYQETERGECWHFCPEWKDGRSDTPRNGKVKGVSLPGMERWKEWGSQEWKGGWSEAPRNGKVEGMMLPGKER